MENDDAFVPPVGEMQDQVPDSATANAWTDFNSKATDQIIKHREKFAEHAYGITQTWVGFLIVITLAQFLLKPIGFGLDYKEFIAVFTTTTAAVFGFGLLVGKFLFPTNGKANNTGLRKKAK